MDSNTHSLEPPDRLASLAAAVDGLAAEDLARLPDAARAERILELRRLLNRLQRHLVDAAAADGWVRTARALFGGPLTGTATALTDGELSVAHAAVLAHGTHDLPAHTAAE